MNPLKNKDKIPLNYLEEEAIPFSQVLLVLARQIKIILIVPALLCSLAIIQALFFTQPLYKSSAKIISSSGEDGLSQAAGLAAQFGINMRKPSSEQKWAYPEIIKSRTIAKKMLQQKFDTKEFGPQKSLSYILSSGANLDGIDQNTFESNLLTKINSMISVSENIKTSILTVSVISKEARFSAQLNKILLDQLDLHQKQYNKSKTLKTKKFIQDRIIDIEKELNIAEEELRDFITSNRRIDNSALLLLEQQRLTREVSVLIGVFTTLKQQLETTKIEEVKESNYVAILDYPDIPIYPINVGKKLSVLITGFFGLGLGIIIGLLREYFNKLKKSDRENIIKAKTLLFNNLYAMIRGKFRS